MSNLSLSDWKEFLSARRDQESGKDEKALNVFDNLLHKYPGDSHLTASKAISLQRLDRGEEAAAAIIASSYSEMGMKLVGDADTPESWDKALSGAIKEIDEFEATGTLSRAFVAW